MSYYLNSCLPFSYLNEKRLCHYQFQANFYTHFLPPTNRLMYSFLKRINITYCTFSSSLLLNNAFRIQKLINLINTILNSIIFSWFNIFHSISLFNTSFVRFFNKNIILSKFFSFCKRLIPIIIYFN